MNCLQKCRWTVFNFVGELSSKSASVNCLVGELSGFPFWDFRSVAGCCHIKMVTGKTIFTNTVGFSITLTLKKRRNMSDSFGWTQNNINLFLHQTLNMSMSEVSVIELRNCGFCEIRTSKLGQQMSKMSCTSHLYLNLIWILYWWNDKMTISYRGGALTGGGGVGGGGGGNKSLGQPL